MHLINVDITQIYSDYIDSADNPLMLNTLTEEMLSQMLSGSNTVKVVSRHKVISQIPGNKTLGINQVIVLVCQLGDLEHHIERFVLKSCNNCYIDHPRAAQFRVRHILKLTL